MRKHTKKVAKISTAFGLAVMLGASFAQAGSIFELQWDPGMNYGTDTSLVGTSSSLNVQAGDMFLIGAASRPAAASDSYTHYTSDWDPTLNVAEYIEFSVIPSVDSSVDLNKFEFTVWAPFYQTADLAALRSSIDGYTANLGGIQSWATDDGVHLVSFDLTSLASQNQTTTFRLYPHGAVTGNRDDLYIYGEELDGIGFKLHGEEMNSVPDPGSTSIFLLASLFGLFIHRRRWACQPE